MNGRLRHPGAPLPETGPDLHCRAADVVPVWSLRHRGHDQNGGIYVGPGVAGAAGTLGGAGPIAEHRRSAEVRVKGGRRPSRSDAAGALDTGRSRPDARLSVRGRMVTDAPSCHRCPRISTCTSPRRDMPRRRPSQLRTDAQLLARRTTPPRRPKVRGADLSGSARAAVLQYEHRAGLVRGSVLIALQVWMRSPAVVEPSVTSCGIWDCCGYHRPVAETRDIIEELIRTAPSRAGNELRRRVRDADLRMIGPADGFWWRDQRYWR